MKKFAFAAMATVACVGFVMAEEMTVNIQKVDAKAGTITYVKGGKFKKDDAPAPEPKTVSLAKGAKIAKGMVNFEDMPPTYSAGDALDKGLANEAFSNEKTFARITIADEDKGDVKKGQVTQILVVEFKGFGKFKKDK